MDRDGFLRALWPDGLERDERLVLWSPHEFAGARELRRKDGGVSWVRWCAALDDVPAPTPDERDLYFGVCLQAAGEATRGGRGRASTTLACPGAWLDLDVGRKARGKKNYAQTMTDAMRIVESMPFGPSITVESGGGGLHIYWRWREPWRFESDSDRRRCAALVGAWQALARETARQLGGWDLDSTHDLARVLRLPGTGHS